MFDKKIADYTGNDVIVTVAFLYLLRAAYKGVVKGMNPIEKLNGQVVSYSDKIKSRMEDQ